MTTNRKDGGQDNTIDSGVARFTCDNCGIPGSATYGDGKLWGLCGPCYGKCGNVVNKLAFRAAQEANKAVVAKLNELLEMGENFYFPYGHSDEVLKAHIQALTDKESK